MIHIATELKTSITYTGTGSQKLFDIPFDYLRTSFVKTNVDDIVLTYGEDYVIINRQIEFTVAPISGSHVVIYRETTTDRLVSWADASVLKASDMTINQVQQLHILEEQQDWTKTNNIVMEGTIGWNARFHRIINVGDPVEPQDAVTKQYVEDVKTGFISEMIKVKNSAITEITDIKNKAIEAINNLKASTETYLTQLKDTFKSFVTEKTEEVNSLKESADTSATTATKEADRAKKEADRAQDIVDNLEGLAGITGIATTDEAIAGVVDNKAMTPLKTKKAIEQGTNVFTALNTFRANIAVSNGTAAGSQGQVIFGVKPSTATVQANIIASTTGALNYIATESTGHYFKIGNNTASTSITTNESGTAILSHNAFEFARITNVGVAKWLGNANTATKLETSRTINGVAFDGTKDIIVGSNPVGTIIAVAYTGVPEGYMHCNGAAVNRTTYVNLFNKIGTTYGAGDGSTTFNLPNTVGKFLEGGVEAGTYYAAGLPNITGHFSTASEWSQSRFDGAFRRDNQDGHGPEGSKWTNSQLISFDASRSSTIYGASTTVQPPAMTVIYCIKY